MQKLMQKLLPKFEVFLYWYLIFLLFFISLYQKFPLFGVKGSFVSIRLEDIFIFVGYLLWFIYLVASKKIVQLLNSSIIQALLVFFFIGSVSLFSGIFLTKTVMPSIGVLHYLRRIELLMFLPFAFTVVKTKRQFFVFLASSSIVVFIVNFYALGQKYLRFPAISTTTSELSKGFVYYLSPGERVGSTFAGHYDLAIFLMMTVILAATVFFYFFDKINKGKITKKKLTAVTWISLLSVFSLYVLVLTAARLSFIAVFVGLVSLVILLRKYRYIFLIIFLISMFAIYPSSLRDRYLATIKVIFSNEQTFQGTKDQQERGSLNIPTLPVDMVEQKDRSINIADIAPGEPTDPTQLGVYRSLSIRLDMEWPRAMRAFYKNPLLGTGYSSIGLATDNDYLRMLGEVGILGFIAFTLLLIAITKNIVSFYKGSKGFMKYYFAGILSLMVAYLVNAIFIDVFEASKVASIFWMILGVSLVAGAIFKNAKN